MLTLDTAAIRPGQHDESTPTGSCFCARPLLLPTPSPAADDAGSHEPDAATAVLAAVPDDDGSSLPLPTPSPVPHAPAPVADEPQCCPASVRFQPPHHFVLGRHQHKRRLQRDPDPTPARRRRFYRRITTELLTIL